VPQRDKQQHGLQNEVVETQSLTVYTSLRYSHLSDQLLLVLNAQLVLIPSQLSWHRRALVLRDRPGPVWTLPCVSTNHLYFECSFLDQA